MNSGGSSQRFWGQKIADEVQNVVMEMTGVAPPICGLKGGQSSLRRPEDIPALPGQPK
jgi:hypothetical protein